MQVSNTLIRVLGITVLNVVGLAGCAGDPIDPTTTPAGGNPAAGGFTGLGKYTGISGTYGNGVVDASTGGSAVSPIGTTSTGGVPSAGGSPIATGGIRAVTGGSTGTTAFAVTTGGSIASGGVTTVGGSSVGANGGTGGRAVGGSSTAATTGGAISRGGAGTGGGSAVGSGSVGGTSTGDAGFVWPGSYNSSATASDPTGKHNPGTNCMGSDCHASKQTSRAFVFGGTVYQPGGTTAAANVQIAVTFGTTTVTTYSADNGNFWLPLVSAPSINWSTSTVHLRNGKGEVAKPLGTSVAAACNGCHGSTMRIIGP